MQMPLLKRFENYEEYSKAMDEYERWLKAMGAL